MSTQKEDKIKKIVRLHKQGMVILPSWLESQGISRDLQKRYLKSGWLKSIGTGAYVFLGDDVNWKGALFTLQEYLHLQVHVGALSALSLQGLGHFSRFKNEIIYVFSSPKVSLPPLLLEYSWGMQINHIKPSIFSLETDWAHRQVVD